MHNYVFENFILSKSNVLYLNGDLCAIPPKEVAVLRLLVSRANNLVTKENIIDEVWKGGCVSDESLTRCIYVLRKLLGEKPGDIYINTVYGKGYSFAKDVTISDYEEDINKSDGKVSIAIFPFRMHNESHSLQVYNYIVNSSPSFSDEKHYDFISSALTTEKQSMATKFSELKSAGVNFFITGDSIMTENDYLVMVEVVDARSRVVISRKTVMMTTDTTINCINLCCAVDDLLRNLKNTFSVDHPLAECLSAAGTAISSLKRYPSFSLELPQSLDYSRLALGTSDTRELCHLAGSYISLSTLGLLDGYMVEKIVSHLADVVLTDDNSHALALAMKAFISSDSERKNRESIFHLILQISPSDPEIYYYYANYLVREKKYSKARRVLDFALSLAPDFLAARILLMVLSFLKGDLISTAAHGLSIKGKSHSCDVIVHSIMALVSAKKGDEIGTHNNLNLIESSRNSKFVDLCYRSALTISGRDNGKKNNHELKKDNDDFAYYSPFWLPDFSQATIGMQATINGIV